MPTNADRFAQLAQSELVRRAVQAMPRNAPPATDGHFSELLSRLSEIERKASEGLLI